MLRDLNWQMLEDCRTTSRLTLLYKPVHNMLAINIVAINIVAINIDEHYANYEEVNITTRRTSSISFAHPTARKNCYMYSFLSRTVVKWCLLPATIREDPSVNTLKAKLCSIKLSTHFTRNIIV